MSTELQKARAKRVTRLLIKTGGIPAALRSPLAAVIDGEEIANSADLVLQHARDIIAARKDASR